MALSMKDTPHLQCVVHSLRTAALELLRAADHLALLNRDRDARLARKAAKQIATLASFHEERMI